VMAYAVVRRTREIGVRMAVGATRWDVTALVLREAAGLVGIGGAIGIVVALFVTKPLAAFLVQGLPPRDPVSLAGVLLVLAATGLLAATGPVRRAVRVDPVTSLRYE
jgi:ABC-type antimicrobial peptide transport system permease subunit